jgi:ribosome-associated protein
MELSRSEQKRRVKQLEELAEELAALPAAVLAGLPAGEELRGQLLEAAGMNHDGARKRLIKHITKLLREEEAPEPLYQFLAGRKGDSLLRKKQQHELEHLRDALIEEAIAARERAKARQEDFNENWRSRLAAEIAAKLPSADAGELARLAFFFSVSRNPRHSRELFRMLRAAQEQLGRAHGPLPA